MATEQEAAAAGYSMPLGTAPVSGGDNAIRQNARVSLDLIRDATFIKPYPGAGGDLDLYTEPGLHGYWVDTANIPPTDEPTSGNVLVLPPPAGTGTALTQIAFPYGMSATQFKRFRGTGGYSAWVRMDAGAVDLSTVPTTAPQSPVQLRTLPLTLTTGGSGTAGPTSGTYRMPVKYGATITRWRVHFRNNNPRFGIDGPAATISTVYAGPATSGQFTAAPAQIAAGLTTGATDAVTPWQATPLNAGTEYAIAYTFTAPATNAVVGGGWSASSVNSTTATLTRVVSLPLDAWIEAEAEATVPAVAVLGDSLAAAVGGTLPVYDSVLSQWARSRGVLPVHYTASGDTMAGWSNGAAYKWQRWQHLSRPDAVIHMLGSNDVFGGANLATLKARRATTIRLLQQYVSPVIYSLTITPRTSDTSGQEQVRRDYNTWLKSKPDAARDVFDVVPAISGDDENISPGFNSDGIHLNTAGYAAVAGTITRPLTSTTASAVRGLAYDSGLRDVSSLLGNGWTGTAFLQRVGKDVALRFEGLTAPTTNSSSPFTFPPGYRPRGSGYYVRGLLFTTANPPVIRRYDVSAPTGLLTIRAHLAGEALYGEIVLKTDDAAPALGTEPGSPA